MRVASASVLRVAAVLGASSASGGPILPRTPGDGFGRRSCPAPGPGSGLRAGIPRGDARNGQIPLRPENPLRGPGMTPESLAWTPREPLEG